MKTANVKIPIYSGWLVMALVDDWDEVNKEWDTQVDKFTDACVFEVPAKSGAMQWVFATKPGKSKGMQICHESIHLVNMLFLYHGIELDRNNDEPQAYLGGWFFTQIEKFIKKNDPEPSAETKKQ